jgi:hypothetical protein
MVYMPTSHNVYYVKSCIHADLPDYCSIAPATLTSLCFDSATLYRVMDARKFSGRCVLVLVDRFSNQIARLLQMTVLQGGCRRIE